MAQTPAFSSKSSNSPGSQYHHYIPRFLLRNYADEKDQPPPVPRGRNRRKSRANSNPATPQLQNDKDRIINTINLPKGSIEQVTVSKAFGMLDMYQDLDTNNPDQNRIEKKLSALENRVAKTIANVKRSYLNDGQEAEIMRKHLYDLRKFLFIMLYRSKRFYARFDASMENYSANDRHIFLPYMREKGFKTPRDVWLANIEAFLDIEMDPNQVWASTIVEKAYPPDAQWFVKNINMYYLAICSPANSNEEFLLTENVYGIFEGLNDGPGGAWTDYHLFAPISPDLMIISRSNFLPDGIRDEDTDEFRRIMRGFAQAQHTTTIDEMLLEHLPVSRARNSYSRVINGQVIPLSLHTTLKMDDKFFFKFHRLSTKYVQRINSVLLEQAAPTEIILYRSEAALRTALVAFLELDFPGFKCLLGKFEEDYNPYIGCSLNQLQFLFPKSGDIRDTELYLMKLMKISRTLGDNPKFKHTVAQIATNPKMLAFGVPSLISSEKYSNFIALYRCLGGKPSSLREDVAQVNLLSRMHAMIEARMRAPGVSKAVFDEIFNHRKEFMLNHIPTRILWLYYKYFRMSNQVRLEGSFFSKVATEGLRVMGSLPLDFSGPEDGLVRVHYLFNTKALRQLIYHTSFIEQYRSQHPIHLSAVITPNLYIPSECSEARRHLAQEFRSSITDCGINALETVARLWKKALSNPRNNVAADIPPDQAFLREILSPDRLDEMTVRYETEIAFEKVMKFESRLSDREIADLRFVLFGMIYRSGIGGIGGNFLKSRPIWQERQRYQKNINSGKVSGNKKGGKKKTLW